MTGHDLYEMAMDIAGIRLRSGGIPDTADDLEVRCVSLINMLITENTFLNELLTNNSTPPLHITDLDDTISMHDKLLNFALPYGLCSMLMMPDDADEAMVFHNRYIQAIMKIKSELPGECHGIAEVY